MSRIVACLALVATAVTLPNAAAQTREDVILHEVRVQGLERVSEQIVRSQLETRAGEPMVPRAVSRDIRRLYELGYFTTISAEFDAGSGRNILTFVFEEERIIDDVRIIGNDKLKERAIRTALAWKEGDSFVQEGYDAERESILDLYRSKGFLRATLDIIVEEISASRVRVTYIVDEGKKAKVRSVNVAGNEALSTRKLKRIIKTNGRVLFLGGKYDVDKFENDLLSVVDAYGDVGRLEAEVASTEFDYSNKGKKLDITLFINEGPEYHVDTLDVEDNFVFADNELTRLIEIQSGVIHNKSQVDEDARHIQNTYRDAGYINAAVVPLVTLNRQSKTTKVAHQVREGELKYVRQVRVTGNSVTKDEIVRRQILLSPGSRFDGAQIRRSQNRLEATQYFNSTRFTRENAEDDDRFADLLVDVEEGKTGNFTFGAGFNTDEGVAGFGELRLSNFDITNFPSFSGGGQEFVARFNLGTQQSNLRLSFTDPEFLGYPLSFGVDVFNTRFRNTGGNDFTIENQGGQLRFAKSLSNTMTARLTLRYIDTEISDLNTFVDPSLRELEDPGSTAAIIIGLNRNTSNHFRDPTGGSRHDFSVETAGLGAENDFVKFQHDSIWYFAIKRWDKLSFSFRTREGIAETYGDTNFVPLDDRFFAGGSSTLRGYETRDVGPKALTFQVVNGEVFVDEQAIGGHLRLLNTFEVKYKLNDLVRLYTFGDSGGVWMEAGDFDFNDIRYSVGVGFGIQLPIVGPMRIDYGFPLNPDDDQGSGRLHLQTSFRF